MPALADFLHRLLCCTFGPVVVHRATLSGLAEEPAAELGSQSGSRFVPDPRENFVQGGSNSNFKQNASGEG